MMKVKLMFICRIAKNFIEEKFRQALLRLYCKSISQKHILVNVVKFSSSVYMYVIDTGGNKKIFADKIFH